MKKVYYTWQDVERQTQEILRQIQRDSWRPDYVVGLTRGGLVPANLISQYLEVPMHTLRVSLRDDTDPPESNLWMATDAFGDNLDSEDDTNVWVETYPGGNNFSSRKNILIVDDINDSGATLNWIKQDWEDSCLPGDERWNDDIWGNNVRVAVLCDNEASTSELKINYSAVDLNKAEEDCWIVFPWEDWWK